jgi:hypothetical protein
MNNKAMMCNKGKKRKEKKQMLKKTKMNEQGNKRKKLK